MPAADKQDLRDEFLQERRALTTAQIDAARLAVRRHVVALVEKSGWDSVAGYVPLRTEPGSVELLDALSDAGVRVIVPTIQPDRDLDWTAWRRPDALPLGVGAVSGVDAVIAPALAVAADGIRLGRGGGSYDRALARVRPGTAIVALLYSNEVRTTLPAEPWDIAVTAYVTPEGWHPIGRGNS